MGGSVGRSIKIDMEIPPTPVPASPLVEDLIDSPKEKKKEDEKKKKGLGNLMLAAKLDSTQGGMEFDMGAFGF